MKRGQKPVKGPNGRWTFFDRRAPALPRVESSVPAVDDQNAPDPDLGGIPPWERRKMGILPDVPTFAGRSTEAIEGAQDRSEEKFKEEREPSAGQGPEKKR